MTPRINQPNPVAAAGTAGLIALAFLLFAVVGIGAVWALDLLNVDFGTKEWIAQTNLLPSALGEPDGQLGHTVWLAVMLAITGIIVGAMLVFRPEPKERTM